MCVAIREKLHIAHIKKFFEELHRDTRHVLYFRWLVNHISCIEFVSSSSSWMPGGVQVPAAKQWSALSPDWWPTLVARWPPVKKVDKEGAVGDVRWEQAGWSRTRRGVEQDAAPSATRSPATPCEGCLRTSQGEKRRRSRQGGPLELYTEGYKAEEDCDE